MSSRIWWDEEEQDKVATAIAKHLIRYPGTTLPIAYKAIENVLPTSRRRVMASVAQFDKMLPRIRELMDQTVQPKTEVKVVERVVHVPQKLSDFSIEDLQREINNRLIKPMIDQAISQAIDKIASLLEKPKNESVDITPAVQTPKLKRVMIVGLMGEQQNTIEKEFKDAFDLRFYNKDDPIHSLKSKASTCDEVILMTKFISHKHQDLVKASGAPFSYCNGGVSDLVKQLEAMFVGS